MVDRIQVPVGIDNPTVLRRFLTELVYDLDKTISKVSDSEKAISISEKALKIESTKESIRFNKELSNLKELQNNIKGFIDGNLVTNIKSTSEGLAVVAEEFGTFYNQATAASWYGLTVRAGNIISGFEVGSYDSDINTPGGESYFTINADTFAVGKSIETITDQSELDYLEANNLTYGTMFRDGEIVPALLVKWDSESEEYTTYFNGKVVFTDIIDSNGSTIIDGGYIKTSLINTNSITISSSQVDGLGDLANLNVDDLNLGALSSLDKIETAQLGTTLISGGYIKTSLIDADSLNISGDIISGGTITSTNISGVNGSFTVPLSATDSGYSSLFASMSGSYGSDYRAICGIGNGVTMGILGISSDGRGIVGTGGSIGVLGTTNPVFPNPSGTYGMYCDGNFHVTGTTTGITYSMVGASPSGHTHNSFPYGIAVTGGISATENIVTIEGGNWSKLYRNEVRLGNESGNNTSGLNLSDTGFTLYVGDSSGGVVPTTTNIKGGTVQINGVTTSFTGAHISLSYKELNTWDIVEDTGIVHKVEGVNGIGEVVTTSAKYSSKVLGVYSESDLDEENKSNPLFEGFDVTAEGKNVCTILALGEGFINICSQGGDIEVGDYICSSDVPGKGMKQEDDILHSYTVAKARENVVWSDGDDSIKMIACTYHCG